MDWLSEDWLSNLLVNIVPAFAILVFGIVAARIILAIVGSTLKKTKLEPVAIKLIKALLRFVLYLLVFLAIAAYFGADITGVVALASVASLALSLALQNALTNLFGGFTLLYTKPFVAGDYVEIAGQSGTVKDIGFTYTVLATADNKTISIPNNAVVSAEIVNYSTSGTRRLDITVPVDFHVPASVVTAALLEATQIADVMYGPIVPFAGIKEYGETAVIYVVQVWTSADRYWHAKYAINHNIQTIFQKKGIAVSYPHTHVHMNK